MAPPSPRDINTCVRLIQSCLLNYQPRLGSKNPTLGLMTDKRLIIHHHLSSLSGSNVCHHELVENQCVQISSISRSGMEGVTLHTLSKKLDTALADHNPEAAWEAFTKTKSTYGLPVSSTLSKLITLLSYSSDPQWLRKGYSLVRSTLKEKPELIKQETLVRLCLSLARAQMIIPASKIMRLMLWRHNLPPMDTISVTVMHMVKSQAGTLLASNLLVEICDHHSLSHVYNGKRPAHRASTPKPGTKIFNLILNACVRFDLILKGERLIELMAQIGVVADLESIRLFASICETSGQRDLLKSFKVHVDKVSLPLACKYRLFYDKLLSLHFKFDDIDSASGLIADMYGCWSSRPVDSKQECLRPSIVPLSSPHLQGVLWIQIMPERLEKDGVLLDESIEEFVTIKNRRLVVSNKGLAQVIIRYQKSERMSELSKLVIDIEKSLGSSPGENSSICHDLINACIYVGWLETAHNIIDDMEEMAGICIPSKVYMSLLLSYCREKMFREAKVLREQMRRVGLALNASDENFISNLEDKSYYVDSAAIIPPLANDEKQELAKCLASELKCKGQVQGAPSALYELNSTINFFCKAKMLEDAMKAYKKLQSMKKIQPTAYTFAYLIRAYSSIGMHRVVTILWGDMKRSIMSYGNNNNNDNNMIVSGVLYELLLSSFIRGGYFGRALEIINLMQEHGFHADKWVCKSLFLQYHKGLYRNLKASDAETEAQSQRLEQVNAFRKWVR